MILPPRSHQLDLISCHHCRLISAEATQAPQRGRVPPCPRCGAPLHRRQADSLSRAWAFLWAGLLCYIPANLLPVMYNNMLGASSDSTIMSGVVEFWHSGDWDIALIIFIASIAVPCTKFLVLGLLLLTVRWRNHWARRERARLYRLVEFIGYWSMLDVLVVALVAALVQFNALSRIEPRLGILFFGLAVIFTMLAAASLDPRLIWDEIHEHESNT